MLILESKFKYFLNRLYRIFTGKKKAMLTSEESKRELQSFKNYFFAIIKHEFKMSEFDKLAVFEDQEEFNYYGIPILLRAKINPLRQEMTIGIYTISENDTVLNGNKSIFEIPDSQIIFTLSASANEFLVYFSNGIPEKSGTSKLYINNFIPKYMEKIDSFLKTNKLK